MEQPVGKKRRKLNARLWLPRIPTIAALIILLVCLVYTSTLSGDIKLQIVGDTSGLTADKQAYQTGIQEIFKQSFSSRSKLLINTDDIAKKISDEYPELGDVAIILPLMGRRSVVQVEPAAPSLILGTTGGGFVLDENGRIMTRADNVQSSVRDTLPVLQDESGLELDQGSYAMSAETVGFVRETAEQIGRKKYRIQSMILPSVAHEMHVRLEGAPYYIKFDLQGEARKQAGTFIATYNKLAQDNVVPQTYIDVRVPGKVYYK